MKSPNIQYTTIDNTSSIISNDNNNSITVDNGINDTISKSINNTQGFKPNMMSNIIKAIQDDPVEFNEIENINNTNLQYNNNIGEVKNQTSTLFALKNDDLSRSVNNVQNNDFVPSIDIAKSDIVMNGSNNNIQNNNIIGNSKSKNKSELNGSNAAKDGSNKDEIQEFVEDFLMDAFISSKEIDLEHHKDLFTAPAFDSENNFDQNNLSYLIKQQSDILKGDKGDDNNIQDSTKFDPLLELNKMKNSEQPIKSYSTSDLVSLKNAYSPSILNNDGIGNSNSNQYLNPTTQVVNNRVLSPLESEKNPVLSPMGYNAAMFLASNSIKSSKQISNNNNNNNVNNKNSNNNSNTNNKLSLSNNNQTNQVNSPYNTTIPVNSTISSQSSFDSLNIPKNSEILYSPDLNITNNLIIGNSHSPVSDIKPKRRHSFTIYNSYPTYDKQQSLQVVNSNSLDLSMKKGISYPNILKPDSMDNADSTVSSPRFINSPLVSSPSGSINDFILSTTIKRVSSPQPDQSLSHPASPLINGENDVNVVNSIILNDYSGYLLSKPSPESSNTKKTPSIVLTPSTDSLVLPINSSVDPTRNIIHHSNSLTLTVSRPNTNSINVYNDHSMANNNNSLDPRGQLSSNIEIENMNDKKAKKRKGRKPKQDKNSESISQMNIDESSSLPSYNDDNSDDESQENSKESKLKKNKKRKSQENSNTISSKKKNNNRKTKSEDEEFKDEISNQSINSSNSNNDQDKNKLNSSSNGKAIKYPRIYECKFPGCNKAFTKAHNLRSHERSHMNDRPYSCKYCEKSFVRQYDLLRHERIHTGVKPYVCKKCLAAFSRNDAYNKHIRSCLEKD